ncbi:MAG TPA: class I SAM-dependent methyltransferase [Ardenticatenaceae bacterium]|nr:class I SAM-dependent methyltransferase [Ardenticatenaceae bacterium]
MEFVVCNLCGSGDSELVYPGTLDNHERPQVEAYRCTNFGYGKHHPVVRCRQCGLVYANPRYSATDLLDEYEAVEDPLYEQERQGRVLTFERHLRPIEKMTGEPNGRRLLDIGCYTGIFLEIAEAHGWEAYGVEPSHWAARLCRERGLRVRSGTLEEAEFPDGFFDVATSWDVIEHLSDPLGHLREVHRILKPGGLLAIHTIDMDAPFARLMGRRWPWLMEMHIYYFSRRTLAAMLHKVGFDVIRAEAQGRYQRLSYLVSRLQAVNISLYRLADWLSRRLRIETIAVPINLGDLVTTYARKI